MRIITFSHAGREQVGVRVDDRVVPIEFIDATLPRTLLDLIATGGIAALRAIVGGPEFGASALSLGIPLSEVSYLPVIPRPGKVICIGRNYAAHAAEGGAETPRFPEVFYRGATSLIGHNTPIVRPTCSDHLDFEGEFAFVIGTSCRHVAEREALDYVAGYSLFNDATLRDYQKAASQWTVGKNFDGTGAFGPEFVTFEELPPGLSGLTLTTTLNGEQMQEGHVNDLVFPVHRLIAILSECMTLEAGDVVVTGTPSGVGFARTPPRYMVAGDVVEVAVEGLGALVNVVIDEQ
jgi:acylpyruvate hydrolase